MIDPGMHHEPSERSKRDFHTATYNKRGGETVVNSFARKLAQRAPYVIIYPPPVPTTAKPHPLPIIKKEKYTGLRGAFIRKTLPEAQRTQGIESITQIIPTAEAC